MTTIKFRRDTSANWTSVNPIPAQGEPCYETDTGKLKIGNGSDSYTTLPYVSDGGGSSGDLPIATATTLGGIKVGNNLSITEDGTLSASVAGTTDYTQLENKPQINSVELTGNKTLNDLGIQPKGNYLTALPDNAVTTNTAQTISGDKTFTRGITTTDIFPAGEITFNSTSQNRHINNIDTIGGGYHAQNGYVTFKGDTTLVGDNKLILDGRAGGLKLTAASSADITCENDLIAPNIRTTANGTIKLAHPMNNASGLITLSNNYGQLSISSSLGGTNNLLGVTRGTAYALIDGDNIITKDKDGNERIYINSKNIDTTYMKWDTGTGKLTVDKAAVAHLAMPSGTKVSLTLGSSGTTYTAPADGYVCVYGNQTAKNGFIRLLCPQNLLSTWSQPPNVANFVINVYMPVSKGATFILHYVDFSLNDGYFNFIYAEGTVPTNT